MSDSLDLAREGNNTHLENLRTALAINRATEFLDGAAHHEAGKAEFDHIARTGKLESLFTRIHREVFSDWGQQATAKHEPGVISDPQKRDDIREILSELSYANGNGGHHDDSPPQHIFNANGYVKHYEPKQIAGILAGFYQKLRAVKPFDYGNKLTADIFMTALGKLPLFTAVYKDGIDFRRLDSRHADNEEHKVLDAADNKDALTQVFLHAMDGRLTPVLKNDDNGWPSYPHSGIKIGNIPFLTFQKDGQQCLVTMNGGLVALTAEFRKKLEHEIVSGNQIADYNMEVPTHGFLKGTEHLRQPGVTQVDGFPVTDTAAPLFCLDVNIMTGLRKPNHDAVVRLLERVKGKGTPLSTLNNKPENNDGFNLKEQLIKAAGNDPTLRRSVQVAYDHINVMVPKIDGLKEEIFAGKTKVDNPHLYVSMGGGGSGKTFVEDIVKADCGGNWIKASLDDARSHSELYGVLQAAGHHGDDYKFIEPFGLTVRQWVADNAREGGYNLLYDGTGIVYSGRYDKLVDDCKKNGYRTEVIAVDVPIEVAVDRVIDRYRKKGRALAWPVTIEKHIQAPASFMQAFNHHNLDKISLFANEGAEGKQYLVAESQRLKTAEEWNALQASQGKLPEYLQSLMKDNPDSLGHRFDGVNMPALTQTNTSYLAYPRAGETDLQHQMLAIYDTARFTQFQDKGLQNPNASGLKTINVPSARLAFLAKSPEWKDRVSQDRSLTEGRST